VLRGLKVRQVIQGLKVFKAMLVLRGLKVRQVMRGLEGLKVS
jgi:hypothetical protein